MVENLELIDRSFLDADVQARWINTTKDAKKVIEMGLNLRVQFIGSEEEVIREIAELEMNDFASQGSNSF
ncbi:hypothetical protein V6N12_010344 [Hibiscus sabdariffa]|uniref:Uncharacterized protein n=1 Tax=Hibiscus sabdariffa TaxID=183260 RepID=A0ABR2EJT4_9ROSI